MPCPVVDRWVGRKVGGRADRRAVGGSVRLVEAEGKETISAGPAPMLVRRSWQKRPTREKEQPESVSWGDLGKSRWKVGRNEHARECK